MYTVNKTNGVGKVEKIENGNVTVFFEETGETKVLVEKFTKLYATYNEAMLVLNPEMTQEEVDAIMSKIEEDKRVMNDGSRAAAWLETYFREMAKRQMRNI